MNAPTNDTLKRMRLRYSGACQSCHVDLPAGTAAVYDRATKLVTCLGCESKRSLTPGADVAAARGSTGSVPRPIHSPAADPTVFQEIESGNAGASARREHQRRTSGREAKIRAAHPRLGGLILAVSDDPQSTKAWAVGARGEELLAKQLDGLAEQGARLLHDRRIPGSMANIDHLAIGPSGVYVIDAKRYKGRPRLRVDGGLVRPRTDRLFIGTRDGTKLVAGVHKQLELVRAALEHSEVGQVQVTGMLCFVEADWPLFGGSFTIEGLHVLWPKKATEQLLSPGALDNEQIQALHRQLAESFPHA